MRSHLASSTLTQTVRVSSVKLLSGQQLGFRGERLRRILVGFSSSESTKLDATVWHLL